MSDLAIPSVNNAQFAAAALERNPIKTLGQNDFIKILVAQLTSQDPMNPQKDTEFVAQMAQFSQLEGSKTVTAEMTNMRQKQDMMTANSMLGRRVEFSDGSSTGYVGTVTGMQMENGKPLLVVGDKSYTLDDVVRVDQASTSGTHAN